MLSASDKVKVVNVVEDTVYWHGTVDTKNANIAVSRHQARDKDSIATTRQRAPPIAMSKEASTTAIRR